MIHTFNKKRLIFFPISWANSIARWILGVFSPTGTIKITNDADPGRDKSIALDVNVSEVLRMAKPQLDESYVPRQDIKTMLANMCDGQSIILKDGVLTVNREWLQYNI